MTENTDFAADALAEINESVPDDVRDMVRASWDNLTGKIDALDDERRSLLCDDLLVRANVSLSRAIQGFMQQTADPSEVLSDMALAASLVQLVGLTNQTTRDGHEDWQSTGDKRVDEIRHAFGEMLAAANAAQNGHVVKIDGDTLPRETVERFEAGNPTEDDLRLLREAVQEQTGQEIPEDAEVTNVKREGKRADDDGKPDQGYGLYL